MSCRSRGQHVRQGIDGLDFEQRQRLARLIVEQVRVTGPDVQIHLRIPLDETRPTMALEVGSVTTTEVRDHCLVKTVCVQLVEVFYNRQRLHSSLGYLSPAEYEGCPSSASNAAAHAA